MNTQISSILPQPLPDRWIEKMFDRMLLDYGKKFTDQWGGVEPQKLIDHWAREMGGYSGMEIKRGLAAMDGRDWPPTLPEFKKMCRQPVDALKAYYEAVAGVAARTKGEMGNWSHPAIYWASVPLAFDLTSQTYSQMKFRWESALDEQMDRGEWDEIPNAMLALPEPVISRELAAQRLKELGAATILEPKTDYKLWAKKIIEREKKGDRTLTLFQIQCAHKALESA